MKPKIYINVENLLADVNFLTVKSDYYQSADSLTVKLYTNDEQLRARVMIQNSDVPEIDIDFGDNIEYYSSLGGASQLLNYTERLIADLTILNEALWRVKVGRLPFTKKKCIIVSEPLVALRKPSAIPLRNVITREIRIVE